MRVCKIIMCFVALCAFSVEAHSIGALFVRPLNSNTDYRSMAIRSYDAVVHIEGHIATTVVNQTVHNGLSTNVESTFIFPLPPNAVITDMAYEFNGKWYTASVRERQEAQQKYDSKVRRVLDPALLQQIGDNLFKLNIAPINANSDVQFRITYTEVLSYSMGAVTYEHMLKTTGLSPVPLERVSLRIEATSATGILDVGTPAYANHTSNVVTRLGENSVTAVFGDENYMPDRNYTFVLRSRRNGVEIATYTYVPVESDSMGTKPFFMTFVTPPDSGSVLQPRTIVITADISSSMAGKRIDQLRTALMEFLDQLVAQDFFNIVTFSTGVKVFRPDVVAATPENIAAAKVYIQGISAQGLTNISEALRTSLGMSYDRNTTRTCVFLTDGEPSWGETRSAVILDSMIRWNISNAHICPIGIGLEKYTLLNDMAARSGGFVTEIDDDDSIRILIADHARKLALPSITSPVLTYGDLTVMDVLPAVLPDVSVGDRLVQMGRYENGGVKLVTLDGMLLDQPLSVTRDVFFGDPEHNNRAVARLWAKAKIDALLLEIEQFGELPELVNAVIDMSKRFNILTKYTALYADPDEEDPDEEDPDNTPVSVADVSGDAVHMSIGIAPNPVLSHATVSITLPASVQGMALTISLVDATGQQLATLHSAPAAQNLSFVWDGMANGIKVASGTYRIVVCAGNVMLHAQVIVL